MAYRTVVASALAAGLAALGGCGLSSVGGGGAGGAVGFGGAPGAGGQGGQAGAAGGVCVGAVPTSPVIAQFLGEDDFAGVPRGNVYTYADSGLIRPVADTSSGALVVTVDTGVPSTVYAYAGVGLPFSGCVDLSSYAGVQFTISGTLSDGCQMQFAVVDAVHSSSPPLGACTDDPCYPPGRVFALPAVPTTTTILFADLAAGGPALPVIVPSVVTALQWQFDLVPGDAGGCTGQVTIDNVTLVALLP